MKRSILICAIIALSSHSALAQKYMNHQVVAGLMRKAVPPESECNINGMGNPFCKLIIGDSEMDMWVDGASIESQAKFRTAGDPNMPEKMGSSLSNLPLSFGFSKAEIDKCFMDSLSRPIQKSLVGINWDAAVAVKHQDFILRCGVASEPPFSIVKEQVIINTAF